MLHFDSGAMARGMAYFRAGHVRKLEPADRVVMASVEGTRPEPYTVLLNTRRPELSYCSCPVGERCKHVVATICAILAGDAADPELETAVREVLEPAQIRELSAGVTAVGARMLHGDELVIDLSPPGPDSTSAGELEQDGSTKRLQVVQDESVGWRLVFLIQESAGVRPLLSPARQYRRQDGRYGRIERIPRGVPVHSWCEVAAQLAEYLDVMGGIAPAVACAEQLQNSSAPIFLGALHDPSGAQHHSVRAVSVERLDIHAAPVGFAVGGGSVTLGLDIRANENAHDTVAAEHECVWDLGLGHTILLDEGGLLLIDRAGGPLGETARIRGRFGTFRVNKGDREASASRLAALSRLAARFPDSVSVSYPSSVRVVTVEPHPVFLITAELRQHGQYSYALLLRTNADVPADGLYDGEYRLHRLRKPTPHGAIACADKAVGTAGRYDRMADAWRWELPADHRNGDVMPEPLRIGQELLKAG
ncbi:MAG: hypothetical protein GVY29_11010, partial [Spirochaetes bacterium]|nr:hypothetical protein [Spirochaetota bacterium]